MRKAIGITLFLAVTVISCNKGPEACIEMDKTSANVGESIEFRSCSKRALSYIWTFQGPEGAAVNDTARSEEWFFMEFDTSGSYTVQLQAFKKYSWLGESSTASANFTIN
ncbi:MAG: PKD domain-containing protein [Crocinitomicaceae bacterium]